MKCSKIIPKTLEAPIINVRVIGMEEKEWFDEKLKDHHYLGAGRPVGDYLRQVVEINGEAKALLAWGPSCYALKDRDLWIGWSATQRTERLKLIVQNRRFLLLTEKGAEPNLASQTMGAALRVLPEQWVKSFGYRPLLAETFTDPKAYEGTCYKASNWEPVGTSAGYSRHRADFYIPNESPKNLWLKVLHPKAKELLRSIELPTEYKKALIQAPGVLPITQPKIDSLREAFSQTYDPRSRSRFRIESVLCLIAMAMLVGRREITEIVRFAQTVKQKQRRNLRLPRKRETQFYQVPSYGVFYQVLRRIDPEAFAVTLTAWLEHHAGTLPASLAIDGKLIRDHIGTISLADHEDGTPQAMIVYDQKKGTKRSEVRAAQALVESVDVFDGKIITGDHLYCKKKSFAQS